MTRRLIVAALLFAAASAKAEDALKVAEKVTDQGARYFTEKDTKSLIATYNEDAVVIVRSRKDEQLTVETYHGPKEIRQVYDRAFEGGGRYDARNIVERARFIDPDILLIEGTFLPIRDNETLKIPFIQVRVREGKEWRIATMQIFMLGMN